MFRVVYIFCFKQKTAYEMRISDWSSDVCSSDLVFTDAMLELFSRTDIWVVDALRERPHPTHIHLGATLDAILAVQPGQAILTHMDHSMDYASLCTTLPTAVAPGYDGMIATLP